MTLPVKFVEAPHRQHFAVLRAELKSAVSERQRARVAALAAVLAELERPGG